jgi:hypothetical protein
VNRTTWGSWLVVALGVGLAAVGGCGDDDSGNPDVTQDTYDAPLDELPPDVPDVVDESSPPDEPIGPDGYPPEPYGIGVGDRIADLRFVDTDGNPLTLADVYADRSVKLLWIYATAGWCGVCTTESGALQGIYSTYHPQGLEILAVVFEDGSGNPATVRYAGTYAGRYPWTFLAVSDEPFVLGPYFDKSATPMNMLVDLTDMEILSIEMGWSGSSMTSAVERRLSEIANRE